MRYEKKTKDGKYILPRTDLRCVISAPWGTNLEVLKGCLRNEGIEVLSPYEFPIKALSVFGQLKEAVAEADFFIAVLVRNRKNENVLMETGYAMGLGKPILIIASPKYKDLPELIASTLVVRANITNKKAIEYAIDRIKGLRDYEDYSVGGYEKKARPLGKKALRYIRELENSTGFLNERYFNDILISALKESGIKVFAEQEKEGKRFRFDFAVWEDELQPITGNPLPVEVKGRIKTKRDLKNVMSSIINNLKDTGLRWALLICFEGPVSGEGGPIIRNWPVLYLTAQELFRELESEDFVEIIKKLRNKQVHGWRD